MKTLKQRLEEISSFRARFGKPSVRRRIEPYPGIQLNDSWYAMIEELLPRLNDLIQSNEWSRLRTLPAYPPNPKGVPNPKAADLRKKVALGRVSVDLTARQLRLVREAYATMCRPSRPEPISMKKGSQLAVPDFTSSDDTRRAIIKDWVQNIRYYARLIEKGQYDLLADNGIVYAFLNGYRYQADTVAGTDSLLPKPRFVTDFKGKFRISDKTLPDTRRLFCARSRQIAMAPQRALFPLRVVCDMFLRGLKEACDVFRLESPAKMFVGRNSDKWRACYDVENHDQLTPQRMLHEWAYAMGKFVRPWVMTMFLDSLRCAIVCTSDIEGESGYNIFGELNPAASATKMGIPSGHPGTTLIGDAVTGAYLWEAYSNYVSRPEFRGVPEDVGTFLSRRSRIFKIIAGDNVYLSTDDEAYADFVTQLPKWSKLGLFGSAATILGMNVDGATPIPSSFSYVIKALAGIEHDYRSPDRKYWAYGARDRETVYAQALYFKELTMLINGAFYAHYGITFKDLVEKHYMRPAVTLVIGNELIYNPKAIYSKPHLLEGMDKATLKEIMSIYYDSIDAGLTTYIWEQCKL